MCGSTGIHIYIYICQNAFLICLIWPAKGCNKQKQIFLLAVTYYSYRMFFPKDSGPETGFGAREWRRGGGKEVWRVGGYEGMRVRGWARKTICDKEKPNDVARYIFGHYKHRT